MIAFTQNISSTDTHTTAVSKIRVLIAAGGTGGHVYPGIAIADAVKKLYPGSVILFVGTKDRMEWISVPKAGYKIKKVWISGFHRRLTPHNLLFPVKLITSIIQSYSILTKFKPDVVVSCGGFASGPVGWVAAKMGLPLILQEQNSYPGVTNRMLAKHADVIFTAFEDAAGHLPENKVRLSGNPVRSEMANTEANNAIDYFGFSNSLPVLLIIGGSGGAKAINDAMEHHLDMLHNELGLQIIWQCGQRYYPDLKQRIDTDTTERLRLLEYIDNMPAAYAAADLVISRAGALSCSELMLTGKPSILIPSPNVAGDHQTMNAKSMTEKGAAVLVKDEEAVKRLAEVVKTLIFDKKELTTMAAAAKSLAKPGAAVQIAKEIEMRSKIKTENE